MVKMFLTAVAVLYSVFGLVFVLLPETLMGLHGASLNGAGSLIGRVLGASLLAMAVTFWGLKDLSREAQNPAIYGGIVYNAIDIVVGYQAVTNGVMNAMGWGLVGFHVVLLAGFIALAVADKR